MSRVQERVAAGAAWLDEHERGWVQRVDWDRLDMGSPRDDVLGQLSGDYHAYCEAQGWIWPDAAELGFTIANARYNSALADAWRELIGARRNGGAP